MNKWKNIKLDDETMWPKEGLVELDAPHTDDRGFIQSLVNFPMKNISLIFSKKGSVRSNHYHLTDWHYMYVLEGKLEYFYFSNTLNKVKFINVAPGQIIFTPNLEVHATFFPEKSKLVVVSGFLRDTKSYESDTVRVEFVNFENINEAKANKLKWKPKTKLL